MVKLTKAGRERLLSYQLARSLRKDLQPDQREVKKHTTRSYYFGASLAFIAGLIAGLFLLA